jgi:hypothetical protein
MSLCVHQGDSQGMVVSVFSGIEPATCDDCFLKIATKVAAGLAILSISITFVTGRSEHIQHNLPKAHRAAIVVWVEHLKAMHPDGLAAAITAAFEQEGVVCGSKACQIMFLDLCLFRHMAGSEHAKYAHMLVYGSDYRHVFADYGEIEKH